MVLITGNFRVISTFFGHRGSPRIGSLSATCCHSVAPAEWTIPPWRCLNEAPAKKYTTRSISAVRGHGPPSTKIVDDTEIQPLDSHRSTTANASLRVTEVGGPHRSALMCRYDNALTETVKDRYKTKLGRGPERTGPQNKRRLRT
jgi:hypothetical protein